MFVCLFVVLVLCLLFVVCVCLGSFVFVVCVSLVVICVVGGLKGLFLSGCLIDWFRVFVFVCGYCRLSLLLFVPLLICVVLCL